MKNLIALFIITLMNGSLYYQISTTDEQEGSDKIMLSDSEILRESPTIINSTLLTDIDGNTYNTVVIGNQCWMAENLKVSHYPNGEPIPYINVDADWSDLKDTNSEDAYSYYENDATNESTKYGALYTYAAAIGDNWEKDNKDKQGVCPDGWHLPTNTDWDTLDKHLGEAAGNKLAGEEDLWSEGKLKQDVDFGTTGFSAVPSGYRYSVNGSSEYADYNAYWWTSKEDSPTFAYLRGINHYKGSVNTDTFQKSNGFSVRCVKN